MQIDFSTTDPGGNFAIVNEARNYASGLFNRYHRPGIVYHNFYLTDETVELLREIIAHSETDEEEQWIAQVAGYFLYTGFLENYHNPLPKSVEYAKGFLDKHDLPVSQVNRIINCISVVLKGQVPATTEEKLLSDARNAVEFGSAFFDLQPLHQLELELSQHQPFTKEEWEQFKLQQLLNVKFYLPFSKVKHEPALAQHIIRLKKEVEKIKIERPYDEEDVARKFQDLERKIPLRGIQTFFRSNYRNHINLSAIADNKANIMISVNAILISVLITLLSYKNIAETNPMVLLPVVIFLVTGLTSLIFAVLSIRPKVTSLNEADTPLIKVRRNAVFFGNFVNLPLERYEEVLDTLFRDGELLYGNMVRDLYYLGKVLEKKYRYLTISYNIFMVGFVATVLTFMIALFT